MDYKIFLPLGRRFAAIVILAFTLLYFGPFIIGGILVFFVLKRISEPKMRLITAVAVLLVTFPVSAAWFLKITGHGMSAAPRAVAGAKNVAHITAPTPTPTPLFKLQSFPTPTKKPMSVTQAPKSGPKPTQTVHPTATPAPASSKATTGKTKRTPHKPSQ